MSLEAVQYIFRVLTRAFRGEGRFGAEGGSLAALTAHHKAQSFSGLVSFELSGGSLGRLLFRAGEPIHASFDVLEPAAALARIAQEFPQSHYSPHPLPPEGLRLATAAVIGQPVRLGEPSAVKPAELLGRLEAEGFEGLLAFEVGLSLFIWEAQAGRVSGVELPPELNCRLSQIAWDGRYPPPLSLSARAVPVTSPAPLQPAPTPQTEATPSSQNPLFDLLETVLRQQLGDGAVRIRQSLEARMGDRGEAEIIAAIKKQLSPLGASAIKRFEQLLEQSRA